MIDIDCNKESTLEAIRLRVQEGIRQGLNHIIDSLAQEHFETWNRDRIHSEIDIESDNLVKFINEKIENILDTEYILAVQKSIEFEQKNNVARAA